MATDLGMYVKVKVTGISQVNSGLDNMAEKAGRAEKSALSLANAIGGIASFAAIKSVLGLADSMTSLNSQIRLVTNGVGQYTYVQEQILNISNRTMSSLEATTSLYTRTARAMQDTGRSQKDFLKFTEATSNAMRIGGRSALEQSSALLQLSQALGSGVLQGDEFRSIAENAPILLDLVAKELGVTRGEVKKLASEGRVTSEVVFNAISNASEELKKEASSMTVTLSQSLGVAKSNFMSLTDKMLNSTGVMASLAGGVMLVANNIEYLLIPASVVAVAVVAKGFSVATTAVIAFNAALLANPIVLVAAGIAAAGAALYVFRKTAVEIGGELYTLSDIALGVFDGIKEAAETASKYLSGAFTRASVMVGKEMDDMSIDLSDIFSFVGRVARTPANIMIGSFVYAAGAIKDIFNNLLEFVKAIGGSIAYAFAYPFESAVNRIAWGVNQVTGLTKHLGIDLGDIEYVDLTSGLKPYVDKLAGDFKGIGYHFAEGMKDAVTTDYIGNLAEGIFGGDHVKNRRDNKPVEDNKPPFEDAETSLNALNSAMDNSKRTAKELKDALKFGAEFDGVIDNLYLEMQTSSMLQADIDRLTFFRDVDNRAKEVAAGMSEKNAAVVYAEAQRVKELYEAYQLTKGMYDNDPVQGMKDGLAGFLNEAGTARDAFEGATKGALTSMTSGLADFVATGKLNFRDLTTSILQDIARIMTQWAIAQAVTGIAGLFGGGGLAPGIPYQAWAGGYIPEYAAGGSVNDLSMGGYTGSGGKYEPKGVVHGGEYVFSKERVAQLGLKNLDDLHKGYSTGGFVGVGTSTNQQKGKEAPIEIHIVVNAEDGTVETNAAELSPKIGRQIDVRVDKRMKLHQRDGGSLR